MRDTFPFLQQAGTGLFKAKGSKFHGYAFPLPFHDEAAAERAVDEHLEAVRKEHHAARHVCYAWQFGPARFRAADDGEPGGSAGAPIHGVLRAHRYGGFSVLAACHPSLIFLLHSHKFFYRSDPQTFICWVKRAIFNNFSCKPFAQNINFKPRADICAVRGYHRKRK